MYVLPASGSTNGASPSLWSLKIREHVHEIGLVCPIQEGISASLEQLDHLVTCRSHGSRLPIPSEEVSLYIVTST